MDADQSFLYGVVALQAGLIDSRQFSEFIEVCTAWDAPRGGSFSELLVSRGWIQPTDRAHLDYLVERKLKQHAGDAKAGMASVTLEIEHTLSSLRQDKVQRSIATKSKPDGSSQPTGGVAPVAQRQERYSLNSLHATGGIGRVWLARDAQMGREVALKELRPEQADDAVLQARFLREAQITGQLEHPGIVPVYELTRRSDTGQPFYTMRFVKGRTLSDAAKAYHAKRTAGQDDSLEFSTLLNAFVVVCKAIAYAHSRGVIHRDLKGQNVVLGDFGEVVVLDWGLAKLVRADGGCCCEVVLDGSSSKPAGRIDEGGQIPLVNMDHDPSGKVDLTMHGDALGTPAYMSPEQAAGRLDLIDRRTDVYGLGAMLYQLLTGQSPFSGATVSEMLRRVQSEAPVPPQQLWAEVPLTLQAVCLRALAKQPSARFASANELVHEVEHWQEIQRQQAIEALRVSEALYHSLVESIPIYVWRKDANGRFTFANKWFCEILGKTVEEVIGKTDFDVFPPELAEKYRRDDIHVLRTRQTLRVTEENVSAKGEKLLVQVIKIPVYDARRTVTGTQGIFWDVTSWSRRIAPET